MVNLRGDRIHKSRSDDHKLDSEFDFRLDSIRAEFHGELRAGLDSIFDQHTDMLRIYELFAEHSQRISRLETRVQGR
jgi:hypothetical protein